MFEYFTANNLILPNQSGFRPGDPCINQLLSIIHLLGIWNGFEVRGVFLDISKESLFFLICINYLSDNLLSNPKLFADDTSPFSDLHDKNLTTKDLNENLQKLRILA